MRRLNWRFCNQLAMWANWAIVGWFVAGSMLGWLLGYKWSDLMRMVVWPVLLSAVVGYVTNYIAIQMLFLPYQPDWKHWLTLLTLGWWRQGVVPQRQDTLASAVAERIAKDLLPAETVAAEITRVAGQLLENPQFRRNIRDLVGPVLRNNVQSIVDRITPEVMSLIKTGVSTAFTKENLIDFVERILAPELSTEDARQRFIHVLVDSVRSKVDVIISYLKDAAERYAQRSWLKRIFVGIAEWVGALDWNALRHSLYVELGQRSTRERLYGVAIELVEQLKNLVRKTDFEPILERLHNRARDYVGEAVERFLREKGELANAVERLLDSPELWRWLTDEALPNSRPLITAWLERHGEAIAKYIDLRGRAQRALQEMDVAQMHSMTNQVAGEELGAIQVLGFIIGAVAGAVYCVATLLT